MIGLFGIWWEKLKIEKIHLKLLTYEAFWFGNNRNHILHLLIDNGFVNQAYKDNDATKNLDTSLGRKTI